MYTAPAIQAMNPFWAFAVAASDKDLEKWTQLSYQYGPFFFSLFFLCVLLWLFAAKLSKAAGTERAFWRGFISWTFAIGVALVGFSVYWWASHQMSMHYFEGKILDLAGYERLEGSNFFFRNEWKSLTGEVQDLRRDVHFLVLQDRPFRDGQSFTFEFAKGPSSSRNKFHVVFNPKNTDPSYEIVWNDKEQRSELRGPDGIPVAAQSSPGSGGLFAQTTNRRPAPPTVHPGSQIPDADVLFRLGVLQDEHLDVGSKIDAIDRIISTGPERIKQILDMRTAKEAAVVTFYDLTRHSDQELASKARRVLQLGGADDRIAADLTARSTQERAEAEALLGRIPPQDQAAIVKKVKSQDPARAAAIGKSAARPSRLEVKVTGSSQGDRYYVRASWNPRDAKVVQCLTELFSREIQGNRSPDQESEMMRGRSSRTVYWYSKSWALRMADLIQGCGAKAEFVHP